MRPCANECDRHTGWRSSTKRSTPWCACASRRSSRWPGRVTQKNPEAIPAFQAACQAHLQRVIPPANTLPVRVFSQDESRFGLLTIRRRRLPARGVQPVGPVQHVFEWWYVYGAVEPTTGDRFFLELPYLNADMFQLFIDAFAQAFPDSLNILLLDNSGAHTSSRLTLPANIRLLFLPPYCPELNPIERVWRDLKDALAWRQFTDLEAQQDDLGDLLRAYEASTLQTLTGYPYLVEATYALCV
jgi:transposase